MKALVRYSLFLIMSLLSGYSLLSAHISSDIAFDTLVSEVNTSVIACPDQVTVKEPMSITSGNAVTERHQDLLLFVNERNEEREDDDVTSTRKRVDNSLFLIAKFFYGQSALVSFLRSQNFSVNLLERSIGSDRYLTLRVFRI